MKKQNTTDSFPVKKKIETFLVADNFELKFIRAVSRRGLAVKIILGLLAFNFYQLME